MKNCKSRITKVSQGELVARVRERKGKDCVYLFIGCTIVLLTRR